MHFNISIMVAILGIEGRGTKTAFLLINFEDEKIM
jgi:hypothetical protein